MQLSKVDNQLSRQRASTFYKKQSCNDAFSAIKGIRKQRKEQERKTQPQEFSLVFLLSHNLYFQFLQISKFKYRSVSLQIFKFNTNLQSSFHPHVSILQSMVSEPVVVSLYLCSYCFYYSLLLTIYSQRL